MKSDLLVKQVLLETPSTRSNDKELILKVWEKQGFTLSFYQKQAFFRLYSPETIRRNRQKIQEMGLFPADESTKRGRKLKAERMRIEMKKKHYIPQYDEEGKLTGYVLV